MPQLADGRRYELANNALFDLPDDRRGASFIAR